jgi:Flp pilus assembly protein CpaB
VSRRGRAVGFASAAAVCAGLAASATGGPGGDAAPEFGELREVVVAVEALAPRRKLREADLVATLEVRRVPESFVPPGALTIPEQAVGRAPAVPIPAGSYLLASQFGSHRKAPAGAGDQPVLDPGRRPIEIAVEGAGALAADPDGVEQPVDVVVTTEPGPGGGAGRTYIAARAVELLDLRGGENAGLEDVAPGPATDAWVATLALTRGEALRLIQAESFARSVRLIGG